VAIRHSVIARCHDSLDEETLVREDTSGGCEE